MSRVTPRARDLAERLVAYEMSRTASSSSKLTAAFVVIEKLRPHFGALMGAVGFRALLSRALVLAKAEAAWLSVLQVNADSSFEGLNELETQVNPEKIADGGIVLLSQLLGLLVNLIGEHLTLRLLRNVNDLDMGAEQ